MPGDDGLPGQPGINWIQIFFTLYKLYRSFFTQ